MNLQRLREILSLADDPRWQMRNPDPEEANPEEEKAPGAPQAPGQMPGGNPKQRMVNPAAVQRAADQMLLGNGSPQGTTQPSANVTQEQGPGINLSDNIRLRKMMRQGNPSLPGQISKPMGRF